MASLKIITRPAALLTTAQARAQCRIDDTFENDLLDAYIAAAQSEAERVTGRAIGATVYRLTLDCFPDIGEPILLPRPPLVSVDAISYIDAAGDAATLDPEADIIIDADGEPARLVPLVGNSWPDTQTDRLAAVTITYTAGVDADIDPVVLQAVRLAVAGWYEHREHVVEGSVSNLPNGFDRLLSMIRFRDRDLTRFLAEH